MTEYYNDPSELYDEELIKKQEKNDELADYDIFDLGEIDELFEERKAQTTEEEKPSVEEIVEVVPVEDEHTEVNNVTNVLPPYRRETTERSTEDVTELSRKRNQESYDMPIEDKPIVEKELYEEPELEMGIDELLESLGIHVDINDLPLQNEDTEKTQVMVRLDYEKAEDNDGATRNFSLPEKEEGESDIGSTRHFSLKNQKKPDRAEAEQKLKASRKNLMQNFRVLSRKRDDEAILEAIPEGDGKESMMDNIWAEDGEDLFDAVEKAERRKKRYSLKEEKKKAVISGKAAEEELKKTLKAQTVKLISLGVVFLFSLIISVVPSIIASTDTPAEKLPSVGLFVLLNMAALGASVFITKDYYRNAAISLYYMVADGDTCLLISAVFTFIQQLFTLIFQSRFDLASLKLFTSVAVFAGAMRVLCDYFRTSTALCGIRTLMDNDGISCIGEVESKNDSAVLAHGLSKDGKPKLLYCAETEMKEGIATDITAIKTEEKYYIYASIASVAVAFVSAVLSLIKTKDFPSFLMALMSGMAITLPVMCDTAASAMSYFKNMKLSKIGAAATSYETIREIGKSNAIIMDAADIFMGVVSKFKRVPSGRIAKSDSVVFAAATLKKAGSILSGCFDEIISQMGITLPEAEDFAYEEKLGYSCWIADRRVLVGNRQMLIEHSIPAPTEYEEKQYAGKGSVMYVVVEGELVATFVISYRVLSKARKASADFASTGLVLMLTSKEPCLTEQTVSSALGISVTKVKMVNSKGTGIMEKYRENKAMRKSAGVFCSGKSGSLLALAAEAHRIYTSNKFLFILHIGSHAVAAALMLLAVLWNITAFMSPMFAIFYLLLWSVATVAYTQKESIVKLTKEIIKKKGKKANA
ncbi:MAG: hypothetical protein IKJ70_02445 [Clostridia bacterium]|nr:hypothetical protein [Clostridia bacterium]